MTPKQEAALREYLQEAIVPLIEDVLAKKLGQAMTFAAQELIQPKREWVGLTDDEIDQGLCRTPYATKTAEAWREGVRWAYHQLKEKNGHTRKHITDGSPCWCGAEVAYVDPDTGVAVINHKEPQ